MCFTNENIKANHTLVVEFYANSLETDFGGEVVTRVTGSQVYFDPALINALYGLQDIENEEFRNKYKELCN